MLETIPQALVSCNEDGGTGSLNGTSAGRVVAGSMHETSGCHNTPVRVTASRECVASLFMCEFSCSTQLHKKKQQMCLYVYSNLNVKVN